jgi:hypothetical protein
MLGPHIGVLFLELNLEAALFPVQDNSPIACLFVQFRV